MRLTDIPALERRGIAKAIGDELPFIARDQADLDVAFHPDMVAVLIRTDPCRVRRALPVAPRTDVAPQLNEAV